VTTVLRTHPCRRHGFECGGRRRERALETKVVAKRGVVRAVAGGGGGATAALVGGLVKVHLGPLMGFGGLMTDN
jgi:hypothetical protein